MVDAHASRHLSLYLPPSLPPARPPSLPPSVSLQFLLLLLLLSGLRSSRGRAPPQLRGARRSTGAAAAIGGGGWGVGPHRKARDSEPPGRDAARADFRLPPSRATPPLQSPPSPAQGPSSPHSRPPVVSFYWGVIRQACSPGAPRGSMMPAAAPPRSPPLPGSPRSHQGSPETPTPQGPHPTPFRHWKL